MTRFTGGGLELTGGTIQTVPFISSASTVRTILPPWCVPLASARGAPWAGLYRVPRKVSSGALGPGVMGLAVLHFRSTGGAWMATVRLDIKTETALKRLSVRRGQTRSEVIREAITRLADEEE